MEVKWRPHYRFTPTSFYPQLEYKDIIKLQYALSKLMNIDPVTSDSMEFFEANYYIMLHNEEMEKQKEASQSGISAQSLLI